MISSLDDHRLLQGALGECGDGLSQVRWTTSQLKLSLLKDCFSVTRVMPYSSWCRATAKQIHGQNNRNLHNICWKKNLILCNLQSKLRATYYTWMCLWLMRDLKNNVVTEWSFHKYYFLVGIAITCVLEPSKGKKNYVITLHNMQNPLKNPNTHLNITNLDSWSQNAFIRCRLHKLWLCTRRANNSIWSSEQVGALSSNLDHYLTTLTKVEMRTTFLLQLCLL